MTNIEPQRAFISTEQPRINLSHVFLFDVTCDNIEAHNFAWRVSIPQVAKRTLLWVDTLASKGNADLFVQICQCIHLRGYIDYIMDFGSQ